MLLNGYSSLLFFTPLSNMIRWGCRHPCNQPAVVEGSLRYCQPCFLKIGAKKPVLYRKGGGGVMKARYEEVPSPLPSPSPPRQGSRRSRSPSPSPMAVVTPKREKRQQQLGTYEDRYDPFYLGHALDVQNRDSIEYMFADLLSDYEYIPYNSIRVLQTILVNYNAGAYHRLGFSSDRLKEVMTRVCELIEPLCVMEAWTISKGEATKVVVPTMGEDGSVEWVAIPIEKKEEPEAPPTRIVADDDDDDDDYHYDDDDGFELSQPRPFSKE